MYLSIGNDVPSVFFPQAVVCYKPSSHDFRSGHYTVWSRVEDGTFVHFDLRKVVDRGFNFEQVSSPIYP